MATRSARRTPPPEQHEHGEGQRKRRCIRRGWESALSGPSGDELPRLGGEEYYGEGGEVALPTPSSSSGPTPGPSRMSTSLHLSPSTPSVDLPCIHPQPLPATTSVLQARSSSPPRPNALAEYEAILSVGQIRVVRQDDLQDPRLDPSDEPIRRAIDAALARIPAAEPNATSGHASPISGEELFDGRGLECALRTLRRQGTRCDRAYRIGKETLAALGLHVFPETTTTALGFDRAVLLSRCKAKLRDGDTSGAVPAGTAPKVSPPSVDCPGLRACHSTNCASEPKAETSSDEVAELPGRMCFPFFFVHDATDMALEAKSSLFVAMRTSLGVLGSLLHNAHVARTRMWLRGRHVQPLVPERRDRPYGLLGPHASFGLLVDGKRWELWAMFRPVSGRGTYVATRLWERQMGASGPGLAEVVNSVLDVEGRMSLVAECINLIGDELEFRRGPTAQNAEEWKQYQSFVAWAWENVGELRARQFERRLKTLERVDCAARVAEWVAAAAVHVGEESSEGHVWGY